MNPPTETIVLKNGTLLKGPIGALTESTSIIQLSNIVIISIINNSIGVWQQYNDKKYQYIGGSMVLGANLKFIPIVINHQLY